MRPLALAALLCLSGSALAADALQKTWIVSEVLCLHCDQATVNRIKLETVGRQLVAAPDHFTNPLYESCDKGVDYSSLHKVGRNEAQASLLADMKLPLRGATAVIGTIGCSEQGAPSNTIARVVLDGSSLYYLSESGAVLVLH